jgi:hypothetical protein
LEPSVRYHPLTFSPRDSEPEAFAFALAYVERQQEPSQARTTILSPEPRKERWMKLERLEFDDFVLGNFS